MPGIRLNPFYVTLFHFWCRVFVDALGVDLRLHQKNIRPIPRQYILIANHPSAFEDVGIPSVDFPSCDGVKVFFGVAVIRFAIAMVGKIAEYGKLLAAGDPPSMGKRKNPADLLVHVQRINLCVAQSDANGVYGALLDLFLMLGAKGGALRKRMYEIAAPSLSHTTRELFLDNLESEPEQTDAQVTQTQTPESGSGAPEKSFQAASSSVEQAQDNSRLAGKEQRTEQSTHVAAMRLHERNSNAYIGSAPDIDPEDPKQVADAQYDPEDFFQGYLKRALSIAETESRDVRIGNQRGSIRIQGQCKSILVEMSENLLRTLSVVPVMNGAVSITRLKGHEPLLATAERKLISSDALLWKTTLWASRGRVPCGTSLTESVYLRQWPNMPRLYVFPHALRIAALLIKEPHSLVDIAKVLGIPQRNVFAFYSATHAIGLTGSAERAVDKLFEPATVKKHRRHGLLSRLLSRLHLQ